MIKNITNLTLYHQIEQYRNSDITALYFRNKKVSFKELISRIDIQASKLYSIGVRMDDVVTLLAPNIIETVITIYALNKIGAIISILHPLTSKNELINSYKETSSKFLFIIDARYYVYKSIIEENNINTYFLSARSDLSLVEKLGFSILYGKKNKVIDRNRLLCNIKNENVDFIPNIDSLKPSFYIQSGGTTGVSKTVILNDKCISYPGSMSHNILGRQIKGISMFGLLPFYHGFGISMGLHAPLMNEAACSLMIKYNGREICKKIARNELNVLIVIPYLAKKLLSNKHFSGKKLDNLYATYVGADKTSIKLIKEFDNRMIKYGSENRLLQGYGLSETTAVNFVNTYIYNQYGSVGKPLRDVKVIISKIDTFNLCKENEVGRILINSPSVCLGYLNSDNKNLFKMIGSEKYLVTGDLGYLDKNGYLFLQGRSSDVVKIAGYNVFLNDIENLANSIGLVNNSSAIYVNNVNHPYIALFVESKDKNIVGEIYTKLRDNLPSYSIPEKVIVIDKLPLTKLGKVNKVELENKYRLS